MRHFLRKLHRFCRHPLVNLTVGVLFVYAGISEMLESTHNAAEAGIEPHHAVGAYGLLLALRSLPELFEAVEHLDEAGEVEERLAAR